MNTTRRRFLLGGLQVTAALPFLPSLARGFGSRCADGERVLVIVQLTGGNDGLNTLVPHRQDAYFRARPAIGLPRGELHRLDDDHGLHPSMARLGELFSEGRAAAVHGVGYPEPDRSHFRSMEIWHSADPEHPLGETGWLGRMADQLAEREAAVMSALHIGSGDLPFALRAQHSFAPSVVDPESFHLHERSRPLAAARARLLEGESSNAELAFLRDAARTTYRAAARMEELAARGSTVDYPGGNLGRRLELTARLITGGFGARLFHTELGGFDTHARQRSVHDALLGELSNALAAFQADLRAHGAEERVTTLVFSEFGRRVEENGSKGTDHGAAAPVFLLGGNVEPGLHGTPPDLSDLERGDVAFTTDFRSIYTTLERDWMGLEPSSRLKSLPLLRV